MSPNNSNVLANTLPCELSHTTLVTSEDHQHCNDNYMNVNNEDTLVLCQSFKSERRIVDMPLLSEQVSTARYSAMNVGQSGEGLECPSRLTNAGSMPALSTAHQLEQSDSGRSCHLISSSSPSSSSSRAATLSQRSPLLSRQLPGASVAHCRGLAQLLPGSKSLQSEALKSIKN